LRGVVEKLEGGSLSLEQSLAAFEEGVKLSRKGAQILDAAEHRVEVLLKEPDGVKTVPFEADKGGR
jgi:exodeoxyribonuclease VII small subunit